MTDELKSLRAEALAPSLKKDLEPEDDLSRSENQADRDPLQSSAPTDGGLSATAPKLDRGQIVGFVKHIRNEQNLSSAVDMAIEMLKRERFWIEYALVAATEKGPR